MQRVTRSTSSRPGTPATAASAWTAPCPASGCLARPRPAPTPARGPAAPPATVTPLAARSRPTSSFSELRGLRRWGGGAVLLLTPLSSPRQGAVPVFPSSGASLARQFSQRIWGGSAHSRGLGGCGPGRRPRWPRALPCLLPARLPVPEEGVCQRRALPFAHPAVPRLLLLGGQRQLRAQGLRPCAVPLPRQGRLLPCL